MVFDFKLNAGLVFGIEHDIVYIVENQEDNPNFDEPPSSMILLHLSFFTISIIFV